MIVGTIKSDIEALSSDVAAVSINGTDIYAMVDVVDMLWDEDRECWVVTIELLASQVFNTFTSVEEPKAEPVNNVTKIFGKDIRIVK